MFEESHKVLPQGPERVGCEIRRRGGVGKEVVGDGEHIGGIKVRRRSDIVQIRPSEEMVNRLAERGGSPGVKKAGRSRRWVGGGVADQDET